MIRGGQDTYNRPGHCKISVMHGATTVSMKLAAALMMGEVERHESAVEASLERPKSIVAVDYLDGAVSRSRTMPQHVGTMLRCPAAGRTTYIVVLYLVDLL